MTKDVCLTHIQGLFLDGAHCFYRQGAEGRVLKGRDLSLRKTVLNSLAALPPIIAC